MVSDIVVNVNEHESAWIETIYSTDGLRVYEFSPKTKSNATSVILVHGGMDRGRSFRRLATQLANRGIRTLTYDRRGYGESISGSYNFLEEAPTFEDHLHDLAVVTRDETCLIFGHSIGGTITLAATSKSLVSPRALITYESPLPFMDFWRQNGPYAFNREDLDMAYAANFAKEFMIRMVGEDVWARLPPSTRERRICEGPTLVSEMSTAAHYRAFDPKTISVPTLIGCGSIAPSRHLRATEYLTESIPGATSRIFEGANHGIHLSLPSVMADTIYDFVQKL